MSDSAFAGCFDRPQLLTSLPHQRNDQRNEASICTSTFWANLSFLIASVLYVWLAIWDLASPVVLGDYNPTMDVGRDLYDVVSILAPLFYVINGVIDLYAAFPVHSSSLLGTSLLFALAALLDLAGTFMYDAAFPRESSILSTLAVHMYFVQAIIVLKLETYNDYQSKIATKLLKWGVVLFLLGALIDVIISYFDMTKLPEYHVRIMNGFYLASAVLWLIDAVLYILADAVGRSHSEAIRDPDLQEDNTSTLLTDEMEPVI